MPRVSDEELRKHAEYDPVARELLAAWPEIHAERPTWSDLIARLRTTAEALRAFVDSRRESGWAIAAGKNAGPALNKALPDARAVLAQLDREGLT